MHATGLTAVRACHNGSTNVETHDDEVTVVPGKQQGPSSELLVLAAILEPEVRGSLPCCWGLRVEARDAEREVIFPCAVDSPWITRLTDTGTRH